MTGLGARRWVVAGGHIPLATTGREPEFASRDEIAFLNTNDVEAEVSLTVYYADREPVSGYRLTVAARRVRRVRLNDLIDPEALPLGADYGLVLEANMPVVVEVSRVDTSRPALARSTLSVLPAEITG